MRKYFLLLFLPLALSLFSFDTRGKKEITITVIFPEKEKGIPMIYRCDSNYLQFVIRNGTDSDFVFRNIWGNAWNSVGFSLELKVEDSVYAITNAIGTWGHPPVTIAPGSSDTLTLRFIDYRCKTDLKDHSEWRGFPDTANADVELRIRLTDNLRKNTTGINSLLDKDFKPRYINSPFYKVRWREQRSN